MLLLFLLAFIAVCFAAGHEEHAWHSDAECTGDLSLLGSGKCVYWNICWDGKDWVFHAPERNHLRIPFQEESVGPYLADSTAPGRFKFKMVSEPIPSDVRWDRIPVVISKHSESLQMAILDDLVASLHVGHGAGHQHEAVQYLSLGQSFHSTVWKFFRGTFVAARRVGEVAPNTCFQKAFVGTGLAYGPAAENKLVVPSNIQKHIVNLALGEHPVMQLAKIVFVVSKETPVTNAAEVLERLKTRFPDSTVELVDLDEDNFHSILKSVATCQVLLGVHGPATALHIFMRPGSAVFEIVPVQTMTSQRHNTKTSVEAASQLYRNIVVEEPISVKVGDVVTTRLDPERLVSHPWGLDRLVDGIHKKSRENKAEL